MILALVDAPVLLKVSLGLLTAPLYSSIADRYGRKVVLLLGCIGDLLALVWIMIICMLVSDLILVPVQTSRTILLKSSQAIRMQMSTQGLYGLPLSSSWPGEGNGSSFPCSTQ